MTDENIKKNIQNTFDSAANDYEGDSLHFFMKSAKHLVEILKLNGNEKVLDVACGTGHTTQLIANRTKTGNVIGIDFSEGMLDIARNKANQLKIQNIEFTCMDMEKLAFPANSFDIVNCSYGVFFVQDMPSLIKGFKKVLKPGGKFIASTFTGDSFKPHSDIFFKDLKAFGVNLPQPSNQAVESEKMCAKMLEEAGYSNIKTSRYDLSFRYESTMGWWELVMGAAFKNYVMQIQLDKREEFKNFHLSNIEKLKYEAGIPIHIEAIFWNGTQSN